MPPVPSPLAACVVTALLVVACVGGATESPSRRNPMPEIPGLMTPSTAALAWRAAACPCAVHLSAPDLRLPRAPRHRSDKPSSGAVEADGINGTAVMPVLDAESHRGFVVVAVRACPLAGHPLALLRPPSLVAG